MNVPSLSLLFIIGSCLFLLNFERHSANGQCETPLICLNNGTWSSTQCKCNCFVNWNGARCENLDCSIPEPSECGPNQYARFCNAIPTIRNYCPVTCGLCSQSASSTSSSLSSATPTTLATRSNPVCGSQTDTAPWCSSLSVTILDTYCYVDSSLTNSCSKSCLPYFCDNLGQYNSNNCTCTCINLFNFV